MAYPKLISPRDQVAGAKLKQGIPKLAGINGQGGVGVDPARFNRPATKPAFNPAPNSNLGTRNSSVRTALPAGRKGAGQVSSPVTPWTSEEQSRFNRPIGEYRKVNRPGLLFANQGKNPVARGSGSNQGMEKIETPNFYGGSSRANKAVQRSREFAFARDRASGVDARNLARTGGQLSNQGAMNVANVGSETDRARIQTQRDIAGMRAMSDASALQFEQDEAQTERGRLSTKRATDDKTKRDKAYSDYISKFSTGGGFTQDMMSRSDFDARVGYGDEASGSGFDPSYFDKFEF